MSALRCLTGAALVGVATLAVPAQAETKRDFIVDATIVKGCAVRQAGNSWGKIDFGTVSGLAVGTRTADLVASGVNGLSIECTPGTSVSMTADNGDHVSPAGQRQLAQTGVATAVPYALLAGASQTVWTTQAIALSFPVGSTTQVVPIKGRATLPGNLRAGKYVDTVRITVTW